MKCVSAFSGIGGFERGFEAAGISTIAQIEWDTNCQTILDHHWPNLLKGSDIRDVSGSDVGRPDIIVGGFPCQDTSIAAPHRRGLGGERSGLFYEFQRLVGETLRIVDYTNPRWVVIENPPGLLKSRDGDDMAAVVRGLEDLGYGWAYRVVDARHLGSTQRRQRVLVVGHRGGDPRPAWQVLGDGVAATEAAAPHRVSRGPGGPKALVSPANGALIWRKSARARKSIAAGGYETWVPAEHSNTLTGFDGGTANRQTHLLLQDGRLRTLTLTEWERLQGFPDGWTEGLPDSARYTALGNAMNVQMATWLGRRLVSVDAALPLIHP